MATQVVDPASFKALFTEFATLTDDQVNAFAAMAGNYINATDGVMIGGPSLLLALQLMTAHLAKSFKMIGAGQTVVVVSGSTEGSVSVSLQAPPVKTGWQWWLATTPYGVQLWALLQVQSAGGFYVGASLERASFRKAGGVF